MASLDKYSPYSTGMTAKQAVEALWNAYNSPKNNCKIITHSNDSDIEIVIKGVEYTHTDIMKLADSILQKDNINNFIELAPDLKNYY